MMTVHQKGKSIKVHNFNTIHQLNIVYENATNGRLKRAQSNKLVRTPKQKKRPTKSDTLSAAKIRSQQRKRQRRKHALSAANEDARQRTKHRQRKRKRQRQQIGPNINLGEII